MTYFIIIMLTVVWGVVTLMIACYPYIVIKRGSIARKAFTAEEQQISRLLSEYLNEDYNFISKVHLADIVASNRIVNIWFFLFRGRSSLTVFDFVIYKKDTKDIVCAFNIDVPSRVRLFDHYKSWQTWFLNKSGINIVRIKAKETYCVLDIVNIIKTLVYSDFESEAMVTGKELARQYGVVEAAMNRYLLEYGLVKNSSTGYCLTAAGKKIGGIEKVSGYFGTYLLWPSHIDIAFTPVIADVC